MEFPPMLKTLPGRTLLTKTAGAIAALIVLAGPAAAQDAGWFWNWGGGSSVGGSGREVVSFPASHAPGQIIVSFSDRRLYHVTGRGQAVSYPIATPRQQSRWQGVMRISQKRVNPSWTPTPTMRRENPRLPAFVPGGHPQNPMGVRALYLGSSMYRIHGTDAPWTIGQPVSKGCIRMYNQDVVDLYNRVGTGTKVTITWQSFGGASYASASSYSSSDDQPAAKRRTYRSSRYTSARRYQRRAAVE
jgi:lipoprotein-anchoring transpeptidase ErfK/SrfK